MGKKEVERGKNRDFSHGLNLLRSMAPALELAPALK
jgi:hypothetical protein